MDRLLETMLGFVKYHVSRGIAVSDGEVTAHRGPLILQLTRSVSFHISSNLLPFCFRQQGTLALAFRMQNFYNVRIVICGMNLEHGPLQMKIGENRVDIATYTDAKGLRPWYRVRTYGG